MILSTSIDVGNISSQKVAIRNGMKKIKTTAYCEFEVNVFAIKKFKMMLLPITDLQYSHNPVP